MSVGDEELAPDPAWTVEGAVSPVTPLLRAETANMLERERSKRRGAERRCSVPGCNCTLRHGGVQGGERARVNREPPPEEFLDEMAAAVGDATSVNEVLARWMPRLLGRSDAAIAEALDRVNAPTQVIELIRDARLDGGTRVDSVVQFGRAPNMSIRVIPRAGVGLLLPWVDGIRVRGDGRTVDLRQVLTGGKDLVYLATWAAARDYGPPEPGAPGGLFRWDEREVLERYFGQKRYAAKGSTAFPSNVVKALKRDFESLRGLHVTGVEDISAMWPEPFIQTYSDRSGRLPAIFRHAPIIVDLMYSPGRAHYTQFPLEILRLDARHASVAMGLAVLVRRRAIAMLNAGGSYEAPLAEWCKASGIDARSGERKDGRAFWSRTADRLTRIAAEASLGALGFAGTGSETIGKLQGNPALLAGYEELRRQQEDAIERETKLLPARRPRRGRP